VVNIAKASVCHKGDEPAERTLTISWDSLGNHIGHGDQIGTCEFWDQGGARSTDLRPEGATSPNSDIRREVQNGQTPGYYPGSEQSAQQDDESSSPGATVQRETTRRRFRDR
jgi:hypothetical protein